MIRLLGKLDFIHRRLWRRDSFYRFAVLLGPAPLVGGLAAGAIWLATLELEKTTRPETRWGVPHSTKTWSSAPDQPQIIEPTRILPLEAADGTFGGYETGWHVTANPIEVSSTLDVDLKPSPLAVTSLNESSIGMAKIIGLGPKGSLYVGVGSGFLVIRTAGVYALTMSVKRSPAQPANCLERLALGPGRIISNLDVGVDGWVDKTFDAARFTLQPGLYSIGWAYGCWHNGEVIGPGRMTLLVAHPGEPVPLPARSQDIVHPNDVDP